MAGSLGGVPKERKGGVLPKPSVYGKRNEGIPRNAGEKRDWGRY